MSQDIEYLSDKVRKPTAFYLYFQKSNSGINYACLSSKASKNIEFEIDTKSSNYFSHVGKN